MIKVSDMQKYVRVLCGFMEAMLLLVIVPVHHKVLNINRTIVVNSCKILMLAIN